MRYLSLRLLPWLIGAMGFATADWVWRHPGDYPWPLVAEIVAFLVASGFLAWKRVSIQEWAEKMLPTAFAQASLAVAFLMVEQPWERATLTLAFGLLPLFALELLFLLAYQQTRYPVHGLSRLNLALAPLTAFSLALGFVGMQVFVRFPDYLTVGVFALAGGIFAVLTPHPNADRASVVRWGLFGVLLGLHVGILCIILPLSLSVIGSVAALAFAWPLRARRYGHEPKPSANLAWAEGMAAFVLFATLILTSRWA